MVIVVGWQWLFPDDEAQIRAVLERIADGVAGARGEDGGGIAAVARAAAVQQEFAPDAVVDAGSPFQQLKGRQAIMGTVTRLSAAVPDLEVRFPDVEIAVADDRQSATAVVTAEAYFSSAGGRSMDARELELTFAKLDDRWVIASATLLQPLERLDQ